MVRRCVAVAMGGTSHEAEVSLRSGAAVAKALREVGYNVREAVLTEDSAREIPAGVEAVYIALHGGYGEGGDFQAALDALKLPYTGPGAAASRLCMDKTATRRVLAAAGLPVAEGYTVTEADAEGACRLALPVVVKPPRDGSSVGLSKVAAPEQWADAVRLACAQDKAGEALVEAYIPGREWAVGVVDGTALPVLEIRAPGGWYDYHAKYAAGVSTHLFPPEDAVTERVQRLSEAAYRATGCRGAIRVDFRVTPEGDPYILELNTAPGCTATSLLPEAAAKAGMPFPQLCDRLIRLARCD